MVVVSEHVDWVRENGFEIARHQLLQMGEGCATETVQRHWHANCQIHVDVRVLVVSYTDLNTCFKVKVSSFRNKKLEYFE